LGRATAEFAATVKAVRAESSSKADVKLAQVGGDSIGQKPCDLMSASTSEPRTRSPWLWHRDRLIWRGPGIEPHGSSHTTVAGAVGTRQQDREVDPPRVEAATPTAETVRLKGELEALAARSVASAVHFAAFDEAAGARGAYTRRIGRGSG